MTSDPHYLIYDHLRNVREILIENAATPLSTTGDAATILLEAMRLHASLRNGMSFAQFYETTYRKYYMFMTYRDYVLAGEGPKRMELNAMVELLQGAAEDCRIEIATIERALAALAVSATPPAMDETAAGLDVQHQARKALADRFAEGQRLREIEDERERAIDRQTNGYDHEKRYVAVAKWMIRHYAAMLSARAGRMKSKERKIDPTLSRKEVVRRTLAAVPCVGRPPEDYSIETAVNAMNVLASWINRGGIDHVDGLEGLNGESPAWKCPVGDCASCAAGATGEVKGYSIDTAHLMRDRPSFPKVPRGKNRWEFESR
jgi:hypothetical protein